MSSWQGFLVARFDQLQHLGTLGCHAPFAIKGGQNSPTRFAKFTRFGGLLGRGFMAMD
jgi:hypothetical protein